MAQLHEGEIAVGPDQARRLVDRQVPRWRSLPLHPVAGNGTQHRVYRLGEDLTVRFPLIEPAQDHVHREAAWLAELARKVPVAVPLPVAVGEPGDDYPFAWLVSTWVAGTDLVDAGSLPDAPRLGAQLAEVVGALWSIEPGGGPTPGKRGGALAPHDEETRRCIDLLPPELQAAALAVWEDALAAPPRPGPPVWVHGDLIEGNLLVASDALVGVIDWASAGVGDPACDLMVAWALGPAARAAFVAGVRADDATWARARGWVIEQAAGYLPYYGASRPKAVEVVRRRLVATVRDA